jgi:hypothetical protein
MVELYIVNAHARTYTHTRVYVSDSQKTGDCFSKQLFAEMREDLSPNQGLFKFCMKYMGLKLWFECWDLCILR